ncbi:MAG: hypothetical protein AB7I27_09395 [Bacteriovoracaceae bacterium]
MNTDEIYQKILKGIETGGRGLVRLNNSELDQLNQLLLQQKDLEKILCIIEHSAALYSPFESSLIQLLSGPLNDQLTVFALNCARKHIIQARFQRGQRLDFNFLEILKKLLYSKNPEVVEWTLRTIEECSSQGVYFLREFDKIKPPPWKWFNAHQRAVREIITMLERRWGQFERSK